MAPSEAPILRTEAGVATIRLAAPERHNALSLGDIAELMRLVREIGRSDAIRVVALRASGRSFCAGHDLGHFDIDTDRDVPPPEEFAELADAIESLPMPTICVLQGGVYGGGMDLALACDFRIGCPATRMNMPAAAIGIHLYPGVLRRSVGRLGLAASKRICLLGAALGPDEMKRIGFLDELVPDADLDDAVDRMAAALARGAPLAMRGMKAALNAYSAATADESEIAGRFRASFGSADVIEGLNAKKNKRDPVFTGR